MGFFSGLTANGLLGAVGRMARAGGGPFAPPTLASGPGGEDLLDRLRTAMDPKRLAIAQAVLAGDFGVISRITEPFRQRRLAEREEGRNPMPSAFEHRLPVPARAVSEIPSGDPRGNNGFHPPTFGERAEDSGRQHEDVHLPPAWTALVNSDPVTPHVVSHGPIHPAGTGGRTRTNLFRRVAHQDGFDRQFDHRLAEQIARQTGRDPNEVHGELRGVNVPQVPPAAEGGDIGEHLASQARRAVQQARRRSRNEQAGYAPATAIPTRVRDDAEFQREVSRVARKYNLREDDLYRVISYETAGTFNPSEPNRAGSSAMGLIQFMTNEGSWARDHGYTPETLARMSRAEQMALVDQYFAYWDLDEIESPTIEDLYMTILSPALVHERDDFEWARRDSRKYQQNNGFDTNSDGIITRSEAVGRVRNHVPSGGEAYRPRSPRR